MEFYELMVKAFNESGWSQNYVSREFNINRGLLHRFYRGIGSISREDFREIIYKIPLSISEKKLLTEKFYKESLGGDTFRRIVHIKNVLKEISDEQTSLPQPYKSTPLNIDDPEKITILNSSQIKMAVDYIFQNVSPCKVYTNYPFSFTEMDNAVFGNYFSNRSWDILHMIIFKIDGEDGENIDSLFRSFRWVERQCTPYYVISGDNKMLNTPYPCFFAADSYCLLFNPKSKKGFFIKNDDIFECIKEVSDDFMKEAARLASFPKDMFELKNDCCRISDERIDMTVSNNPCIASIINEESVSEVIRSDIPDAESIKKVAIEHYGKLASNEKQKYVTTDRGLKSFVENGKVIECPPVMLIDEKLPIKYRKKFLENLIDFAERGRVKIIDGGIFTMPDMSIELGENNIQIFCVFRDLPENLQYCGNGMIILNDKRLRKDIELFIEYLQVNREIYSEATAVDYLKSLLTLCEGRETKQI